MNYYSKETAEGGEIIGVELERETLESILDVITNAYCKNDIDTDNLAYQFLINLRHTM